MTVIFVVMQGDNVWIAADSLQTGDTGGHRYACKINSESRFYWAASANVYEDVVSGYSIQKMVSEVASTKGTLADVMAAFVNKASVDSAKEFSMIKKEWPEKFAKYVHPPDHTVNVAKVVFVEKNSGHPPEVVYIRLLAQEVKKSNGIW
jgi:hypothetical protein